MKANNKACFTIYDTLSERIVSLPCSSSQTKRKPKLLRIYNVSGYKKYLVEKKCLKIIGN